MSVRPPLELSVILAAGGGRRMGRAKGLLPLQGMPLLTGHIEALAAHFKRTVVVLGADHLEHRAILPPHVLVVHNPAWAETWPADSLQLALRAHITHGPVLITPVDTPPVRPQTLERLLLTEAPCVPCGPSGRPGHPILLHAEGVARLRRSVPVGGLRTLLGEATAVRVDDPWVHANFNRPADWHAWTEAMGYTASG